MRRRRPSENERPRKYPGVKRAALRAAAEGVRRVASALGVRFTFVADGLLTIHNADFIHEPRFMEAYRLGASTGHAFGELHIEWRMRVILWAAQQAVSLPGDFVECGTNTGIYARAVLSYIDLAASRKRFFLLDTFAGIPEPAVSAAERAARPHFNDVYTDCWSIVQSTFAPFPAVRLVRGVIPDTLAAVDSTEIAFASIDLNVARTEIEAIAALWPRLVPGAIVVIDDYGWPGHEAQKHAWDAFVAEHRQELLPLPTGQAVIVKKGRPAFATEAPCTLSP